MHTDVNRIVAQFVTIMLLYPKLPNPYEAMNPEAISFFYNKMPPYCKLITTQNTKARSFKYNVEKNLDKV